MSNSQPHRKQVKHIHVAGHFHELTFSCYQRKPLLTNDAWRKLLAGNIDTACECEGFALNAFVFMPEHVHLLVLPSSKGSDVGRLLARIKRPYSRKIREIWIQHRSPLLQSLWVCERPGKFCFRFWQEGPGFDRNLVQAESVKASIEYLHMNPVKRGLCQQAIDWKWSSARFYFDGTIDPSLPKLNYPPSELFDEGGTQLAH